jgi:hypothetical protein
MVSSNLGSYNVTCKSCGVEYNILAREQDIFDWVSGAKYIQDALDYLSQAEREMFISGICGSCWKTLYGEEYDREDDLSE